MADGGSAEGGRTAIHARSPKFSTASAPRYWWGGNALATHMANGGSLLFPSGERFFIRSVRHFLDRIDDPALRADVQGFFAQEARHGAAHQHQFADLRAQGYPVDAFLAVYERLAWRGIEPVVSPEMRLAVTVALEHFTAIMAHGALEGEHFDAVAPELQALLRWHAAEEIEHKAVAFDVLRAVAPSYRLRVTGLALATTGLLAFWTAATVWLLVQDWKAGRVPATRDVALMREQVARVGDGVLLQGIRAYLRRDFHPSQIDDAHLAAAYLARAGLEPVEEKA